MKTSVNLPEWLLAEVQETMPGMNTSQLVRDALLIALREWRRGGKKSLIEIELTMRLREERAKTARAVKNAAAEKAAARKVRRPPAKPKPAPGAPPAHPKAPAAKSATMAGSRSRRPALPKN
jgi:hypothetical protein